MLSDIRELYPQCTSKPGFEADRKQRYEGLAARYGIGMWSPEEILKQYHPSFARTAPNDRHERLTQKGRWREAFHVKLTLHRHAH